MEMSSSLNMWEGTPAALCLMTDISERKRGEEELQRYHDRLEGLVKERAIELETTNLALIKEIEDRKRSEKALHESEQRLELALKGGALGLWDWNLTTGRAVWDERATQMLGYGVDEMEPQVRTWKVLVHPDDWHNVSNILNGHISGQLHFFEARYRMRSKSGQWRWYQGCGKIVEYDPEGRPLQMSGTVFDINEQKQSEENLKSCRGDTFPCPENSDR